MKNPFEVYSFKEKENSTKIYQDIERGTSFTIPVFLKDEENNPILLPQNSFIYFTLKSTKFDFDYDDDRALIKAQAELKDEKNCRYDINLSSRDTWLPPGEYYFDIMLRRDTDIYRLYSATTSITEAPSNRYQSDVSSGTFFGEPICLGEYRQTPIEIKFPGVFLLNPKDMPLSASPSFLLEENLNNNTKQIQHFTSRMRFPLNLIRENFDKKTFIFDIISPFNFREKNQFGEIKISLKDNFLTIWSIPLQSEIKYYGNSTKTISVGSPIELTEGESFEIRISLNNDILILTGRYYGLELPLLVEWFDFNK